MNEANVDLAGQKAAAEVPSAESAETADDRMLTTRLPPITPPPPRTASVPPSNPPPAPSFAPSATYRSDAALPPAPRTSWWRALLTATFPPPPDIPADQTEVLRAAEDRLMRRRVGATCAGMALGFVILALAMGLRGAEPAYTPIVSAAMVVSRSLIALGFLAFGASLLRMAERFLTNRDS
jgi:hypothetical protein